MSFFEKNKTYIKLGVISGIMFALVMVAFDYFMEREFSILKFALHFVLFGCFNAYMAYRKVQKEEQKRNKDQ
ncbi:MULTISPECIES: hypothetical protein [Bizionia]|uniref:Uncharacterized protein n=1 Tax=Bizionia algoritergicola TaxID=291187 RepID=A0A5D0QY34_9FLAO|nr:MULTISPECIES: hypothetical protein [Bizionia]OBX21455.1 hypothetical protein BAA08_12510 [Bizionia sp. APA-3]TYB73705.1 hypothetical protein ES675_08625 [Bizionia algoritergicola]